MKTRTKNRIRKRRGMTIVETVLAMTITAMVGGAISTMMAAVSDELTTNQGTRSSLIRAGLAQSRLSSYIARSHCVLDLEQTAVTLWLEDSRDGNTVHATEIRWIVLNNETNTLESHFVCFPDNWSEAAKLQADTEYTTASNINWKMVLKSFQDRGLSCSLPLVEGIITMEFTGNEVSSLDTTLVETSMSLSVMDQIEHTNTAESIRVHQIPENMEN
ncbi:MAG: hypothetical protein CMJ40_11090 [Phycisphaerae bacterium]|nr:hypothetical protein [Phycisphaerae bacterium]